MIIFFDLAGVLFHWQPNRMLQRLLPAHARVEAAAQRLAEAFFQGHGGDWAEFDRRTLAPPDWVKRIAVRTGLPSHQMQAVVDAVPAELQPMPDTVALLRRLRDAGRPLCCLSNMPLPCAEYLDVDAADCVAQLQRQGWV